MLFGRKKRRISRILVIEDEPLVAFDTEHFLTDAGFEVVAAIDSVAAAIAALDVAEDLHLVLLDVNLADGSGVDVARVARSRGVEVLFVTGRCPVEARELAAGCLSKPYPQRDLLAAIDAIETMIDGGKPRKLPQSFNLFARAA
ncbi:response regulator transcription factor [Sphingomonas baiyangensis]|uniref:Response regulator n=1 Tax=Sphingomonas baiyangensis TaxID=2572576 RepID=A0A4V5PTP2_9SPHN|nr:response regulator [Sphingomonas baiyangensis]TKD50788.1 response regulator [Sphingomonas baiyangensis]